MKKFTGWVLLVFCSVFLLMFAVSLIAKVQEAFSNSAEIKNVLGYFIIITLLIFGLRSGLKMVRKNKTIEIESYDKDLNIKLSGKIKYRDYRNLIFRLNFKNYYYIVFIMIFLLLLYLLSNKDNKMDYLDISYVFFIVGIFLFSPIFSLIRIKKTYDSSKTLQNQLDYILTNDSINIKGDTVDSTQKWTHFYQIRETSNFFMFYEGEMAAILLDKRMFSESELLDFMSFMRSLNVRMVK